MYFVIQIFALDSAVVRIQKSACILSTVSSKGNNRNKLFLCDETVKGLSFEKNSELKAI